MRIKTIGATVVGIAVIVTLAAKSVGGATLTHKPTELQSMSICRGITWPMIPMECLNDGTRGTVRFIRSDFEGHEALSAKADRLRQPAKASGPYVTVETRGNGVSILTLIRRDGSD